MSTLCTIFEMRLLAFTCVTVYTAICVHCACELVFCAETDDVPLADSSAAESHVAQREISRESRLRQTDSYRYSFSSSRSTSTSDRVVESARTWLPLATVAAVIHYSSQFASA